MADPSAPQEQSEPRPAPVRRPPREEVRRRLLEAASETFLEKGYLDSTLDDIARRAGLSKGAVYSNFDSKQEIFGALLGRRIERMNELMAAVTDPDAPGPAGHRASEIIAEDLVVGADWIQLVLEFASRAGRDVAVREIYRPFLRAQLEGARRAIEQTSTADPEADREYIALVATILVALRNGLALEHAADPEEVSVEVAERALDTVIAALAIDRFEPRTP